MREIKTVTLIGLGAMGACFTPGLRAALGPGFRVMAEGERKARLERGVTINGVFCSFPVVEPGQPTDPADLIINAVKAPGYMNKANVVDCTADVASRLKSITGYAAVMLQKNITGDLDFSKTSTAILDLNGYEVNGNIIAGDRLIIVDSKMGTADCGTVTGTVSGNAIIAAGKYTGFTVPANMLRVGYVEKDDIVQNELYTIDVDTKGTSPLT